MRFLSRVTGEGDRLPAFAVAEPQTLLQLLVLAVAKRVHRVNDEGGDAHAGIAGALAPQHVIDDGDEVGERFAGVGRQHLALAAPGDANGVGLVPMRRAAFAEGVVRALDPENRRAFRVESAVGTGVVNVSARLEVRIQLDERGRPETASGMGRIDPAGDIFGPDAGEVLRKPLLPGDAFFTEGEYVHQLSLDRGALARASIAAHRSSSASNGSSSASSMPSASIFV